jgi:hypothetical protein
MSLSWKEIGLSGSAQVRGLWEHKTFGQFNDSFGSMVEPHGVMMLKIAGITK